MESELKPVLPDFCTIGGMPEKTFGYVPPRALTVGRDGRGWLGASLVHPEKSEEVNLKVIHLDGRCFQVDLSTCPPEVNWKISDCDNPPDVKGLIEVDTFLDETKILPLTRRR